MVLWSAIDTSLIEHVTTPGKDKTRFKLAGGALKFQIPRAFCRWGVSAYKSFQVDISNPEFLTWWRDLEFLLCSQEPFVSNLKGQTLRLKIDEAVYIFEHLHAKQVNPEVREGLFRGQELSVQVVIEGSYFFNGNWGLICRASQVRFCSDAPPTEPTFQTEVSAPEIFSLKKGTCAFL
jgi:hypothetical protein